jgi:SOS-response transcriptional repressor LexA
MQDRSYLTERQLEVLLYLERYVVEHGETPTLREICRAFGIRSTNAVVHHVRVLVRKGFIEFRPGRARGIRLLELPPPQVRRTGGRVELLLGGNRARLTRQQAMALACQLTAAARLQPADQPQLRLIGGPDE